MKKLTSCEKQENKQAWQFKQFYKGEDTDLCAEINQMDLEFVDVFFNNLISCFDLESESNDSKFKENVSGILAESENLKESGRESKIKKYFQQKLNSEKLGVSIQENIKNLEKKMKTSQKSSSEMTSEILLLIYRHSAEFIKNPNCIFQLIKLLSKMCIKSKNQLLRFDLEKNMILDDMKNLKAEFQKAKSDYETKKYANSFLAVRSFTFGMAEIMDKETLRLKSQLKSFQNTFQKKINRLENKLDPAAKYAPNKIFTSKSKYSFKPVTPNENMLKNSKRNFSEFQNSHLDSLFKKKMPPLFTSSPKMFSPCPNIPFFDPKKGSNLNSLNSKSKNMISMPEIKTPFSVKLGILQDGSDHQELFKKEDSSIFVKQSPLNFEHNEVEIPEGIKRVLLIRRIPAAS